MSTSSGIRPATVAEPSGRRQLGVVATAPHAPQAYAAEQYRVLSHITQQLAKASRKVIAISSPIAGDGKTTTSINLARALSQSAGVRVLLIDADLRRGSLGEQLGIARSASPGLGGMIADPLSRLDDAVRRRPGLGFAVLPAGVCPAMPYEALRSARIGELIAEARERFDHVLLDTPPVVPVADLRAISEWVDGIYLVVSAHITPRGLLDEALSAMDPDKVVGIVYNGDDLPLSRRHRSYYSYGEPVAKPGLWSSVLGAGRRP